MGSSYEFDPDRLNPIGRRIIPLALRVELYRRAKELRMGGLSYSKIAKALRKQYNTEPSKGQLSEWLRGIHGPFGSANRFLAEPTPELAYVIGVTLGDGSLNRKRLQPTYQASICRLGLCAGVRSLPLQGARDSETHAMV